MLDCAGWYPNASPALPGARSACTVARTWSTTATAATSAESAVAPAPTIAAEVGPCTAISAVSVERSVTTVSKPSARRTSSVDTSGALPALATTR